MTNDEDALLRTIELLAEKARRRRRDDGPVVAVAQALPDAVSEEYIAATPARLRALHPHLKRTRAQIADTYNALRADAVLHNETLTLVRFLEKVDKELEREAVKCMLRRNLSSRTVMSMLRDGRQPTDEDMQRLVVRVRTVLNAVGGFSYAAAVLLVRNTMCNIVTNDVAGDFDSDSDDDDEILF